MPEANDSVPPPALACPTCGESMICVLSANTDDIGPRHMEFECPSGHHVVVELHETYEDEDLDHAV